MKKILSFLFFFSCLALFAQEYRELKIFVPPVEGTGRLEDNVFFFRQLTAEVVSQHHLLLRSRQGSDFILKSIITNLRNDEYQYVFTLELIESASNNIAGTHHLYYNRIEQGLDKMISTMVFYMLSHFPDIEKTYEWRDKKLFLCADILWLPRIYEKQFRSVYWQNFGFGISGEFHFIDFMSLEFGVQISQDWVNVYQYNEEYRDLIIEFPSSIKFVFKPLDYLVLSPYGGVSFNFSVTEFTKPSLLSWFCGVQLGIKAGIGMIVIDPRICIDIFDSEITQTGLNYSRNTIQIGIGYKLGFLSARRNKKNESTQTAPPLQSNPPNRSKRERESNTRVFYF